MVLLMAIFAVLISLFLAQSSELPKSKKRTSLKNLTSRGKRAKSAYSRQKFWQGMERNQRNQHAHQINANLAQINANLAHQIANGAAPQNPHGHGGDDGHDSGYESGGIRI